MVSFLYTEIEMASFTREDIDDDTSADELVIFSYQLSEKFSILSQTMCLKSLQKSFWEFLENFRK